MSDNYHVDVRYITIDESYEEKSEECKYDESRQEAQIFLREYLQSGPRIIEKKELSTKIILFPYLLPC